METLFSRKVARWLMRFKQNTLPIVITGIVMNMLVYPYLPSVEELRQHGGFHKWAMGKLSSPSSPTPTSKNEVPQNETPQSPPQRPQVVASLQEPKPQQPKPAPSTPYPPQEAVAKLRERQAEQENAETKTAAEVQQKMARLREQQAEQLTIEQRVASVRAEQAEKEAAQQRVAALRSRVGSGGSGEGTGSSGGSGSSDIRLRTYEAELQAKIYNAWNIPPQSKGLQASVFLIVNRAGQVEQARLVQGSGNTLFDESLQRAIKQAQPLPPLPGDYTERSSEVTLRFRGRN